MPPDHGFARSYGINLTMSECVADACLLYFYILCLVDLVGLQTTKVIFIILSNIKKYAGGNVDLLK
jgi:hypothetical protein